MNAEEVKVPDVEGDWQSIEIFLFSNGQQNSPPRKYHLRAEELNLWDDTLSLLAQLHYGLQSPPINLYTTDGHLVEGPLELKDGLAYVAVIPPDTFIDTGYKKYLIRASRSWEKRQARKKIPRCCDLQTCCLCPEKEDAESLESLLWATGHPELRPAGGHFMSSAPSNPAAADDYKPRYAVRLSEYGASPAEFGYSPVESAAKPDEYVANPSEHALRLSENGSRLGEFRTRPDEYGAKLNENAMRPGEYEAYSSEHAARLDKNGASPEEFGPRPNENVPIASKNGIRPVEYGVRLDENGARLGEYVASLSENGPRLTKDGARLKYGTRPGENAAIPGEYQTRPRVNRAKPGEYIARSGEYKKRPSINRAKPSEYGAKAGKHETRPCFNGAMPSVNTARPGEYEPRPVENETRPGNNGLKANKYGAKPAEYETKPGINGAKPSGYGARPGEYETRPSINGAKPSVNTARPSESETRPTVNGAKLSEYKARPGENVAKPSEYNASPSENATRPSVNADKPSEFGARLGEYETKPSVNGARYGVNEARQSLNIAKPSEYGARPGEYETRPIVNGALPGEYRARPDESKPIVNGAMPGEHRTRPGEYADRSAEQRSRPNEYEPRPAKSGAWSDEDGVRATVHETRPGNDRPWLNENGFKKEAYEVGLRDNERSLDKNVDRPDKDTIEEAGEECKFRKQSSTLSPIGESKLEKKEEYKVTEGDNRDKQIDTKGRASGNGRRGGERRVSGGEQSGRENDTVNGKSESRVKEIENLCRPSELRHSGIENKRKPSQQRGKIEQTRRISGQTGAKIEQGGRTVELIREFEHGDRVSEPKGKETNPAGRAGVNAARQSEQRNKESDHLVILGGRENRVGDHEARAGDLGLRRSHDAGLVNPGSKVADPGARAAVSGSRASPRRRMGSIARTSNLSQPKLGTPGTRADKTAVKLDESEIKNRVGYPGARQISVGGTGEAGASYISEAQQHARRSSLSAGRASTEKKRLSIGQNSSLLKKPTPINSVLHKSKDKQRIKTNKEILAKRMTKASAIPDSAFNDARQSKTFSKDPYKRITPPALQSPTLSLTNLLNLATNKASLENVIDEKEIIVISTHSFGDPEIKIRLEPVKEVVDILKHSPKATQTELAYVEKSKASVNVDERVQTNTEAVAQHGQEVSASSKAKVNSCTCTCALCCKRDHRVATVDPDENIISIQNKSDVIYLKLNIEVRNIVKSIYSCKKNCLVSRSLTKITRTSEKDSQISIDDGKFVPRKSSLQSRINHQYFQGYESEGSPKVMVVQCPGCGRLNYPSRCDLPLCCDNYKKYFVLLASSANEDMDDCCNFNPPCRPCELRQSQLNKTSCGIPIKRTLSEMILDNITVSGVPLQRREIGIKTDTACQIQEPQDECVMTKRKVSISKDSGTRCHFQKESSASISVTKQFDNLNTEHSCRKLCPEKCEHEDSPVCLPVTSCQKVQSVRLQVSSQACPQVESKGWQQTSPQIQSQECMPVSPTCSPCCPKPLPFIQVQIPKVSDAQSQTQWNSIVLQARLHADGRYSFHLPPLNVLNSYPF